MTTTTSTTDRLLDPAAAAELLGVDVGTLREWRRERLGPSFHAYTRQTIRYRESDPLAFMAASYRETA